MIRIMDEERYDQLYNRILDGENWDYSTLDELICLSESGAREKGKEEMKKKAIDAHCKCCPNLSKDNDRMCKHLGDCNMECQYMNDFINQL